MTGEEKNPPNDSPLFYIRQEIMESSLTMGTANYQAKLFEEIYNQPDVKDAFLDEVAFVNSWSLGWIELQLVLHMSINCFTFWF
jgi:hypothetical protein